jgi:hypothetical protein
LADDNLASLAAAEKRHPVTGNDNKDSGGIVKVETASSTNPNLRAKKTFVQELALYNGTFSDDTSCN